MLLFFFMATPRSPFKGCWDALFILGPWYLCAVFRCWGIDRVQWWTGSVSPAANQKVNSLSIAEGKWPPGPAHTRKQQLKCNSFWLCQRVYGAPVFCASLLFMPLSILIFSVNAILYQQIISLENLCCHLWNSKAEPWLHFVRGKGYRAQLYVFVFFFLAFICLHCLSFCPSLHTFICAFLSWKLQAVFVNAKLESNPVMTSLRLCVRLGD